jgi:N-carbamoyl-L-amino-acid hydrolase
VRDLDASKISLVIDRIREAVKQIETETGTKFDLKQTSTSKPALTDARFKNAIAESAKDLGLTTMLLPSGAGHDAQEIADICPIGMIFIPSQGGISHSPKEFSEPTDIINGANVLLRTLLQLDDMSR